MGMTKTPVPPPPGDRPVRTAPPPPPGWRHWLWPAALLVTVLLYLVLPAVHGTSPVSLNYSQFSSQVTAHKVKTVTFASGASGSNTEASGTLSNGKTYETVIPGGPSTAFSQQLSHDGVKVTADPPGSSFGSELLSWLIILLPLIFIFYLFRRMAKNSGAAGHSQCRQPGGGGGAVRTGRSPGGGGTGFLVIPMSTPGRPALCRRPPRANRIQAKWTELSACGRGKAPR